MTDVISAGVNSRIKVGDMVMVAYPVSEQTDNPAHKLDGEKFVVRSVRKVDSRGGDRCLYELYGAVSDMGVYYVFLSDELIKL